MLHEQITGAIIASFYEVHHDLGHGFLEAIYEHAMVLSLVTRGLAVERQVPVSVHYRGKVLGDFLVDLIVENRVMVELKACRALEPVHAAQVINYLRATPIEVGLLLNFGHKPVFRRLIMTNDRKPSPSLRSDQRLAMITGMPAAATVRPKPAISRTSSDPSRDTATPPDRRSR